MTRVLVTGATGIVGSETVSALRAGGHEVIAVSARGSADGSVLSWRMGVEPAPSIPIPDVVVHAAADTRLDAHGGRGVPGQRREARTRWLRHFPGRPESCCCRLRTHDLRAGRRTPFRRTATRTSGRRRSGASGGRQSRRGGCSGFRSLSVAVPTGQSLRLAGIMKLFRPILAGLVLVIVGDADAPRPGVG